ncbi:MAG: Cysteinyl-tRNA synthetase [Devosia sp.]|uniref:cysteine--tRNA ligase n=1 Tax=Devosia sp. TaxID=1871048 RepID=UPI002635307B|nr:cysteine--tRNA ligase [Devosia sp.]MDB5527200.1 Cysteinyl-tRNA synthetase [Devosia sp.]
MTSGTPQLSLYNTLTRKKEPFVPIDAANVRMYACGPTVYDFAHIGNGRMAIVFDLLFRLLRQVYGPDHVTYVRNITDVDDKINARAARDFPGLDLNEAIRKVTEKTAAQYQSDVTALGCLEPTIQPRATDNIEQMQTLITALIKRSHAYEANGEVLFEVGSMPDYGKLSGRNPEDNLAGARVAVDAHKKNPADFVLWKQSSAEEPGWDSPWGRGRPGWHIECSAMSERYLGQLFDIHGGGLDLIFPHHENEIAQSRCAHGTHAMANVWMHNGFLQVEGEKMSKSLGNFFTIAQLLETTDFGGRKWPGEVLRLAMLMTHYRQPIDFTVAQLQLSEAKLKQWYEAVFEHSPMPTSWWEHLNGTGAYLPPSQELIAALSDDLNSHLALSFLDRTARPSSASEAAQLASDLHFLGFDMESFWETCRLAMGEITDKGEIDGLVAARGEALANKDFATADRIRAELAEQGIALMDSKDPETGERRTKWEIKR